MKAFRLIIFLFGLLIIIAAKCAIHGSESLTGEQIFSWILITVIYVLAVGPFTLLSILPKRETFSKMISVFTAYWYATTAYCVATIAIVVFTLNRSKIIASVMDLPNDWLDQLQQMPLGETIAQGVSSQIQNSAVLMKASAYNDRLFSITVVVWLILTFVYLVILYSGCLVSHHIGNVEEEEKQQFSQIVALRQESTLLAQEAERFLSDKMALKKIENLRDGFRYLSPVNSNEGFDKENQMLQGVKTLRELCKQGNSAEQQIQTEIDNLSALLSARKTIYKN